MKKLTKGFTLIELLIVIALLGALAVGLLAALDPFEQLKKGTDTGTRNLVSEVHGAIIRYYGIKNHMPWCPTGENCPADPSGTNLDTAPIGPMNAQGTALANIKSAGELKPDFAELAGGKTTLVFVTGSEADASVSVCFRPTSKSFLADPNSKYDKKGVEVPCDKNDLNTCFWCVK